jgi:ATP-dependent protease ClpP protease subunit
MMTKNRKKKSNQKAKLKKREATMNSKSWFSTKCVNSAEKPDEAQEVEICIYDEIGMWGITAKDFVSAIKQYPKAKTFNMRFNTPGGSIFDGFAIYNYMNGLDAKIVGFVDGVCASMGSVILMACDEIEVPENAFVMIHNPVGTAFMEDSEGLRGMADLLDNMKKAIVGAYAKRSGKNEDEISGLMDTVTYMNGKDAVEMGFADRCGKEIDMAACADVSRLEKLPEALQAKIQISTPPAEKPREEAPLPAASPANEAVPGVPPAEQPAIEAKAAVGPAPQADPRAEAKAMLDLFGKEKGAQYFADGLTLQEAKERYVGELKAENGKLKAQNTELATKLAKIRLNPAIPFQPQAEGSSAMRVSDVEFEAYCKENGISGEKKEKLRASLKVATEKQEEIENA